MQDKDKDNTGKAIKLAVALSIVAVAVALYLFGYNAKQEASLQESVALSSFKKTTEMIEHKVDGSRTVSIQSSFETAVDLLAFVESLDQKLDIPDSERERLKQNAMELCGSLDRDLREFLKIVPTEAGISRSDIESAYYKLQTNQALGVGGFEILTPRWNCLVVVNA